MDERDRPTTPPSSAGAVADTISKFASYVRSLTASNERLRVALDNLTKANYEGNAAQREVAQSVRQLIEDEREERLLMGKVLEHLAKQGTEIALTGAEVKEGREDLKEISAEIQLTRKSDLKEPGEGWHAVVGRALVDGVQHKLTWMITAGLLGAWHLVRSWWHG
jgi:hypothetical protein